MESKIIVVKNEEHNCSIDSKIHKIKHIKRSVSNICLKLPTNSTRSAQLSRSQRSNSFSNAVPNRDKENINNTQRPLAIKNTYNTSISDINEDGSLVRAQCSQCYDRTLHGRIEKNLLRRNVFICQECTNRTLFCRWCRAMARGHLEYDEELCSQCDGSIKIQGDKAPNKQQLSGQCSQCFRQTKHNLRMANFIRRDSYVCENCGAHTAICIVCRKNFTRCNTQYDEKLCAMCNNSIDTQSQVEKNIKECRQKGIEILESLNSYEPFAPCRKNVQCKIHIDGKSFMESVANEIEAARESIYMSFWHMNHMIYLRRNGKLNDNDRLDNILYKKASVDNVKIYILLWRENVPKLAIDNFSSYVKKSLKKLHPNINIIRHGHPAPFTTFQSHHQKFIVIDQQIAFVGGFDICLGRQDTSNHCLIDPNYTTFLGVDYYNPHVLRPNSIRNSKMFEDVFDRDKIPRMPQHDVDIQVRGSAARDIAQNFIQRQNHHKQAIYFKSDKIETLQLNEITSLSRNLFLNDFYGTCRLQAIRSIDTQSGGTKNERSIEAAYIQAIKSAQHFIYIENQYLSGNLAGGGVENKVIQHVLHKLEEKIEKKEKFRVIFVLPQPEEIDEIGLCIMKQQYQTINRGGSSILEILKKKFPETILQDYIAFFFLRNQAFLNNIPVTEKIFVHSKLMIVDDIKLIITSANQNDRSFLGNRDSELGFVVEDENKIECCLNKKKVMCSKFVRDVRLQLQKEHLGIDDTNLDLIFDAPCDECYKDVQIKTADSNTEIYETIFPSIPSDKYKTMKSYEEAGGLRIPPKPIDNRESQKLLKNIRGFLTQHPIGFLIDDKLEMSKLYDVVLGYQMLQ